MTNKEAKDKVLANMVSHIVKITLEIRTAEKHRPVSDEEVIAHIQLKMSKLNRPDSFNEVIK